MPNLSSLANIPGYGAYIAKRQMNEQQGLQDLQQASTLLQLRNAIQGQQQEQQLRSSLAQSGGDVEAAMQAALRAGRADVAAKLAPIVEARRKATEGRVMSPGSQLVGPNNQVLHQVPFKPDTPPADVALIDFYNKLPTTDPRKPLLKGIIDQKATGQVMSPVAGVDAQGNQVFFQPSKAGGAPQVVPGVRPPPKAAEEGGLTPENAGKVAMAQQSVDAIGTVRNIIFNKDGSMNRGIVGAMGLPIVSGLPMNSQARIARSAIRNAIEAKLRLETGAAATESEVERTLARFMPTVADTPPSAKFKLDELEKFFKSSLSLTKGIKPKATADNDPLGIRK